MTKRLHPLTLLIYFAFTIILPSVSGNPIYFLTSLFIGLIMFSCITSIKNMLKSLPAYSLLFIILAVFNPLFYHDGNTVLFYLNGKRITLEALIYGVSSATMVISVLVWCRCLTELFSSDKIMYCFGRFSPKTALIISMVLRFVPLYRRHISTYRNTQKLLGIYGEGTFFERLRGEIKIFGGFLSWLLEHSMTTSDSMTARGYGAKKRKSYNIFHFKPQDLSICLIALLSAVFVVYCIATQTFAMEYYPELQFPEISTKAIISIFIYIFVAIMPAIGDLVYGIKCKTSE